MDYVIGEHFEKFIREAVKTGRYSNANEVVQEGLRLVELRDAKLKSLKEHIDAAIEGGGSFSDQEIEEMLTNDDNILPFMRF